MSIIPSLVINFSLNTEFFRNGFKYLYCGKNRLNTLCLDLYQVWLKVQELSVDAAGIMYNVFV